MVGYTFPFGIKNDHEAADIICYAFPKRAIVNVRYPYYAQVHRLIDALKYAQTRCASNSLGKCIRWARSVINEEKGAATHERENHSDQKG